MVVQIQRLVLVAILSSTGTLAFADCRSRYASLEASERPEVNKRAAIELAALVLPYAEIAALAGVWLTNSPAEGRKMNYLLSYAQTLDKNDHFAIEAFGFHLAKRHIYIPEDKLVEQLARDDREEALCVPDLMKYNDVVERYVQGQGRIYDGFLETAQGVLAELKQSRKGQDILVAHNLKIGQLEAALDARRIYVTNAAWFNNFNVEYSVVNGVWVLNRNERLPILLLHHTVWNQMDWSLPASKILVLKGLMLAAGLSESDAQKISTEVGL